MDFKKDSNFLRCISYDTHVQYHIPSCQARVQHEKQKEGRSYVQYLEDKNQLEEK